MKLTSRFWPLLVFTFVGYSGSQLRDKATIVAPQFLTIGKADGSFALQDFKPNGEGFVDNVFISLMDKYGLITKSYVWVDYAGEGEDKCWADGDTYDWPEEEVFFMPGQGLWIDGVNTDQSVVGSGEVSRSDVLVQLRDKATQTGNPFPTQLALQDITPIGEGFVDNVFISLMDKYGLITKSYVWVDYAGEGEDKCWADGDTYDWPEEEVFFAPGQGLWVDAVNTDQYLQFPSPISDAE